MRNGELFIQKFNELDHVLRQITGVAGEDRYSPFSKVVDLVADKNVAVRKRKEILKRIGKLRNAIIHDRDYPNRILADPRSEVIEELESVLAAIARPQKLIPKFQKTIRIFTGKHSLADCLSFMIENDFSQVVVAHESEYVLLSSEGIVKWLENARDVGLADLEGASVLDALRFEDRNICRYLSRNDPVDAAFEMFEKAIGSGIPRLQGILITENGKPQERPRGIVTPWDLLGEVP